MQRHLSTRWKHKTSQDKIKDRNRKFEGIKSLFRCKRDIINFHSHLRMVINVSKRTEDTREKRYSIDKTFIIKKNYHIRSFYLGTLKRSLQPLTPPPPPISSSFYTSEAVSQVSCPFHYFRPNKKIFLR